jgi:hypothetical protein
MIWKKRGRIHAPDGLQWWAKSYATIPTVVARGEELRIYFASLDEALRGRIGYIDVASRDPSRIIRQAAEPVLDLGARGLFDDCGVNPSSLVTVGNVERLYYIGWQRCQAVPYLLFSGVAEAREDGKFERLSPVPILDRTETEPYLRSAMSVLAEGDGFRAWYVSGHGWLEIAGRSFPTYSIRHAESGDGLRWQADPEACIALGGDEFGLGRPWVLRDRDLYRMWYSIRSRTRPYRIGYAESADGRVWTRRDDVVGIAASAEGWDSEMICYACVVDAGGERHMFYNGNRHGASGIGWATLEG